MKKRRLIAIFSVLVFLVFIIVLFYTVLVLRKVQIVFLDDESNIVITPEQYSKIDVEEIFSVFYGKPILFLDKNALGKKAAEISAYIKVVDIVKEFPNKAIIYLAERKEVFSFEYYGTKYCMDNEGIILGEIPLTEHRIDISNSMLNFIVGNSVKIGEKLRFTEDHAWKLQTFLDISKFMWSVYYDYEDQKQIVNLIEITEEESVTKLIIGEANCLEFVIINPKVRLNEKLNKAFSVYMQLEDKSNIEIFIDTDEKNEIIPITKKIISSNFS